MSPGPEMARIVRELRGALRRTERALKEASALLALSKRKAGLTLGGRGRLHEREVRQRVLSLVDESVARGARLKAIGELLGLSARSVQRWRKSGLLDNRCVVRRVAPNRLSLGERAEALALLDSEEFGGLSPKQVVPRLADRGIYMASESTLYRLRRATDRRARRAPPIHAQRSAERMLVARAPDEIWSWDITYLKGPVRGAFYYLYLIMDVFSRRIVGWHVDAQESANTAAQLIHRTCEERGPMRGMVLRSDNGPPMRGATMRAALQRLGVLPSFSRPGVSNDNPFSEALFRTMKRWPSYPRRPFASPEEVRAWVERFVGWYNREHLHSGIGFVSPDDRYFGRDLALLARRKTIYERARQTRPDRWTRAVRCWAQAGPISISAGAAGARPRLPTAACDPGDNLLDTHRAGASARTSGARAPL